MNELLFLLTLVLLTANCAKQKGLASGTSPIASTDCTGTSCYTVTTKKVEGVVTQRQLLPTYVKCTGLPPANVSATTTAAMSAAIPSLSTDGNISDISAPLLMAVTNVASEFCRDLIAYERPKTTGRVFFGGYSLKAGTTTAVAGTQTYDLNASLKAFANACWGRAATDDEVKIVFDSLTTKTKDDAEALYACTAMLSSAQAIRF